MIAPPHKTYSLNPEISIAEVKELLFTVNDGSLKSLKLGNVGAWLQKSQFV